MNATLIVTLILLVTIIYILFKNLQAKFNVSSYIINTYCYIFGSILLIFLTNIFMEYSEVSPFTLYEKILPITILTFILLFGILYTSRTEVIQKHLMWLGFMILLASINYPIYMIAKENGILIRVITIVGLIFLSMSYLAYSKPSAFFDQYYKYFFYGLFGLVVIQALDLIFGDIGSTYNRFYYYSLITVVLFSGFIYFDTRKLYVKGLALENLCKAESIKGNLICGDYPTESLNITLDLLNLFSSLVRLNSN